MKIRTAVRHVREGTKNVVRNGWMTFASISSISISLFILGVFLLLTLNVNYLADQIEGQVEIRVFLDLSVKQDGIDEIQKKIEELPNVKTVKFVSKAEGLKYLRDKLGDIVQQFEGDENPLNDSFTIQVNEPRNVGQVADSIKALNNNKYPEPITEVKYGQGQVEKMFKISQIVRYTGLVLVALLAVTAIFLIANTIKLTILARRREISIMKLVGATNSFIRWPFFIEGAILGLIGSLIPVGILLYGYAQLLGVAKVELATLMIQLMPFGDVGWKMSVILLLLGVMIGIGGSLISVRKFLRV
jgi:cell division transport system permease protein